jgi:dimethylhistidine N-methyltransferase
MNDFAQHVKDGLSKTQKELSSSYLYDERGTELFQSIMKMPEYYPTDSEYDILSRKQNLFARHFGEDKPLEFIELGAGDGLKIIPFLDYFLQKDTALKYKPVDISEAALQSLRERVHKALPELNISGIHDDYFKAINALSKENQARHIYLFLGGNIGNFSREQAIDFLKSIRENIHKGDFLVVGFDLKKDPRVIQKAYDDPYGLTASFNLNILQRINRELRANFDLHAFKYYPYYHQESGEVRSFLYSLKDQTVSIEKLDMQVHFSQWEYIHTEISKKFDMQEIEQIAVETGFMAEEHVFDCKHFFTDSIFKAQ